MTPHRIPHAALLFFALGLPCASAQATSLDSDHDGLTDAFEDALLARFIPTFMVSESDCSAIPARFAPGIAVPTVLADDGTIYAQAFPRKQHPGELELHFYHLWRRDCGEMSHPLDTEHVSVLLTGGTLDDPSSWSATYWYAAAHEDTVCDASQITRAETLSAEHNGATVWISTGKHASYLAETLCTHGCGGDRCPAMKALPRAQPINLGEAGTPMNGSVWVDSRLWPLTAKLSRTDFSDDRLAHLERLPATGVAWVTPGRRPEQAAIRGANAGLGGTLTGVRSTDTALDTANRHTGSALDTSVSHTGSALSTSFRNVKKALGKTTRKTAKALGARPEHRAEPRPDKPKP